MKPILCYVTGGKSLEARQPGDQPLGARLLERIRAAIEAGADWVQIREKQMLPRALLELARGAVALRGARIFVNDRADVALLAGAAGVHLGGQSALPGDVIRWLAGSAGAPAEFLAGVSCHSLEEAAAAEDAGADYIFFGPVFQTPAKESFGPPQGIARLTDVCRSVEIPVIAIGGIDEVNAAECICAGAAGVAAIRMFQDARDPAALQEAAARLHGIECWPTR